MTNVLRLVRMQRQEERALKEALQKMESLKLERERLLNDPAYIEEIARRDYGMVGKGEEIFQITLPDSGETKE
ncbi:MAG: septum formation initiator family protein [Candidatus Latescibacteria bacterium]|nr:septum formation initiator family protein [Candidatus Latescibacterota bacterium]